MLNKILKGKSEKEKRYVEEDSEIFMPSQNTTFDNQIAPVNNISEGCKSFEIENEQPEIKNICQEQMRSLTPIDMKENMIFQTYQT